MFFIHVKSFCLIFIHKFIIKIEEFSSSEISQICTKIKITLFSTNNFQSHMLQNANNKIIHQLINLCLSSLNIILLLLINSPLAIRYLFPFENENERINQLRPNSDDY